MYTLKVQEEEFKRKQPLWRLVIQACTRVAPLALAYVNLKILTHLGNVLCDMELIQSAGSEVKWSMFPPQVELRDAHTWGQTS